MPRIQFLSFDGCPLADVAQDVLERALRSCGLNIDQYELVNVLDPSTPENLANWGSPTILVDGHDVSGHDQADGVGCRLYDTPNRVPTVEMVAAAIHQTRE